jgi:hypothetical protein
MIRFEVFKNKLLRMRGIKTVEVWQPLLAVHIMEEVSQ